MSVWKSDETLLSICILNFSFKNDFVWEEISNIRHSVLSPDETPRTSSKILRCASYFPPSSRCFICWWNTASHVWYITSKTEKLKKGKLKNWRQHWYQIRFQWNIEERKEGGNKPKEVIGSNYEFKKRKQRILFFLRVKLGNCVHYIQEIARTCSLPMEKEKKGERKKENLAVVCGKNTDGNLNK